MGLKRARTQKNGDIFSKLKRSEVMSKIRSKNTKIELLVFSELKKRKIYFQKHYAKVAGKPDMALPRQKKAVFIDSGFWHGYKYETLKPKLVKKFWRDKIEYNMRRDRRITRKLRNDSWKILRIWDHQLRKKFGVAVDKIANFLVDKK
jgi:DNA mismatch endonuclease (patch repair protein)